MVPETGIEPVRPRGRGIFLPLRLSPPPIRRSWSGLSLHPGDVRCRCCPSSLYTFPLAGAWLGIASEGFPDFEQFCTSGFPQGTQWLKSDASTSSATPASAHLYGANCLRQREYSCFRPPFEPLIAASAGYDGHSDQEPRKRVETSR